MRKVVLGSSLVALLISTSERGGSLEMNTRSRLSARLTARISYRAREGSRSDGGTVFLSDENGLRTMKYYVNCPRLSIGSTLEHAPLIRRRICNPFKFRVAVADSELRRSTRRRIIEGPATQRPAGIPVEGPSSRCGMLGIVWGNCPSRIVRRRLSHPQRLRDQTALYQGSRISVSPSPARSPSL